MKHKYLHRAILSSTLTGMVLSSSIGALAAPLSQSHKFADPAFQRTWDRTDSLVASGKVKRSFYWGPFPITDGMQEAYAEGPGGKHLVQYFDKSRMEINDPNADKSNPFYVTNGLLTVELITGRVQVGNSKFENRYHAEIPLASDTDDPNAPTYASFKNVYGSDFWGVSEVGPVLTYEINRGGNISNVSRYGTYGIKNAYLEKATKLGIASVFWDFLNASGPVLVNGKEQTSRLSDPYFYATGYPITNAFWASVKIENKPNTDVLIQAFERRVLTYVPSAPEGFKVQMGNIGQHYFTWRYQNAGRPQSISCDPIPGAIGTLWKQDTVIQNQLLCAENWEHANIQIEHFERGHVVYVQLLNVPPRTSASTTAAYVFADDGTVKSYFGDRKQGDPGPPEDPPTGLLKPSGEPGRLWRESAEARKLLGWATTDVKDIGEEERQFFERGLMVGDGDKIYMFYNEEFFFYAYPAFWNVYTSPTPFPTRQSIARACALFPQGKLGKLWSENLLVQNRLGCIDSSGQASMAFQPFVSGAMVYMNVQSPHPPELPSDKLIYALSNSGNVTMYVDDFSPATPEPPLSTAVPPGKFEPRQGFGKVWRENNLLDTIGWATAQERGLVQGESYLFQHGVMLIDDDLIYVLYGKETGNNTPGFTNLQSSYLYFDRP